MRISSLKPSCINWIYNGVRHAARRLEGTVFAVVELYLKKKQQSLPRATFVCVGPQRQGVSLCSDLGRLTFQADMAKCLARGCSLWGDSCTLAFLCTLVAEMVAGQGAKLARQLNQGNFQIQRYDENAVFTISPLFSVGPLWYSSIFNRSVVCHGFGRKYKSEKRLLQAFWKS